MTKADYKTRKYSVEPYNLAWVQQFEDEADKLRVIFQSRAISIEHVGSTAVLGLAGKPTIDILIVVEHLATNDARQEQLEASGYQALGDYIHQGSCLFVKEKDNTRLVILHIFESKNPHVHEMLRVRDYLRVHPEVVEEYSKLKFDLVKRYPKDYGLYRKYKDEWMNKLESRIS